MTIINNSTSAFFERSTQGLSGLRKYAEQLQTQLASGQKLARSSDNPVAASKLRTLQRADSLSDIDMANANRANADLTLTDTALATFADYVTRVRVLAQQAGNDTLTTSARAGIAVEIAEIHDNLVALANSRDSAGHALFGGESAGDAYTLDGSGNAVYVGTASAGELPLGDGQSVSRGLTGPEFLNFDVNGSPSNLMAVVKNLADALQGGSPDPAAAARDSLDALTTGLDTIATSQTVVGARLSWIDLTTERRIDLGELRANEQTTVGATDMPATIARLQEVMLALEASQASFAKLASLSLFDAVG
jgi:flagellar hook-associated protein 3 FlgL